MKEKGIEELKTLLNQEGQHDERLRKDLQEAIRVQEVLVAAGFISEDKIKQAYELVRSFD